MKKVKLYLIIAAMSAIFNVNAIVGDLTVACGGPVMTAGVYNVPGMNNIFVPAGVVFNIDPGVTINFRAGSFLQTFPGSVLIIHENTLFRMMRDSRFLIGGDLLVYGTAGAPARFIEHPLNIGPSWDGIIFDGTIADTVKIDHAIIQDVEKFAGGAFINFSGAMVVHNSNFDVFEIHNTKFLNNRVNSFGGAFCFYNSNCNNPVRIDKCKFENNASNNMGGAVYLFSNGTTDFIVENNQFHTNGASYGGAFATRELLWGDLLMTNNYFGNNQAVNYGGACFFTGDVVIMNLIGNKFENNMALNFDGGAVYMNAVNHTLPVVFLHNTFLLNQARDGGGICSRAEAGVEKMYLNNLFAYNHAGDEGGAVYCEQQYNFLNNTIAYNSGTIYTGGIYAATAAAGMSGQRDNILWGNTPNQVNPVLEGGGAYPLFTFSDIDAAGPLGGGNITVDPLFVDPTMNNFRLSAGSPCFNAGDPALAPGPIFGGWVHDLDGTPRIQGGRVDIGAYETAVLKDVEAGITKPEMDNKISIFPNPARETLTINVTGENNNKGSLDIYDLRGQVVSRFDIPAGYENINCDISNLKPGTYIVVIISNDGTSTHKLIVE